MAFSLMCVSVLVTKLSSSFTWFKFTLWWIWVLNDCQLFSYRRLWLMKDSIKKWITVWKPAGGNMHSADTELYSLITVEDYL